MFTTPPRPVSGACVGSGVGSGAGVAVACAPKISFCSSGVAIPSGFRPFARWKACTASWVLAR